MSRGRAAAPIARDSRLVYSTDPARAPCARCGAYPCACAVSAPEVPPEEQRLIVRAERAGRKGKTVTLVLGFRGPDEARAALLHDLKKACACGGTIDPGSTALAGSQAGAIELAGDQRERAGVWLGARGYRVERRG